MRPKVSKTELLRRFISFMCCHLTNPMPRCSEQERKIPGVAEVHYCSFASVWFSFSPTWAVVLPSHHRSLIINFANLAFAQNYLTLTHFPPPSIHLGFSPPPSSRFLFNSRALPLQSTDFYEKKNKLIPFDINKIIKSNITFFSPKFLLKIT
jgi:hypothetical protein